MRILYLAPVDPSRPFTGTGSRVASTIAHLSAHNSVDLVRLDQPGSDIEPDLSLLGSVHADIPIPYSTRGYYGFDKRFYDEAKKLASSLVYDVIVADFGRAGLYGALLARRYNLPLVYISHNVESHLQIELAKKNLKRAIFAPYLYGIERFAASSASLISCITPADADFFKKWTKAPVVVTPGAADLTAFTSDDLVPLHPPQLTFVGNLTYGPNREAAAFIIREVMKPVKAAYPDVVFKFVGKCPPDLASQAPDAVFTGFVSDLAAETRAARLVLVPVMSGGGMRIKTVEALACGKTVVATPVGAAGINSDAIASLKVVEPSNFAAQVIHELKNGTEASPSDLDYIRRTFSAAAIFGELERHIAGAVASYGTRKTYPSAISKA